METDKFRKRGKEVVDFIADYFEKVESLRVNPDVEAGFLAKTLPQKAPTTGEQYEDIVKDFKEKIMPGILHWQSPHFHGYYPHGYSFVAYLADMLAHGVGSVMFSWASNPAGTELEQVVTDWLGKLLHLPAEFLFEPTQPVESKGGGVIQNTASEAVLVCMLAARKRTVESLAMDRTQEHTIISKLVLYASDQVHSCVEKAAMICAVRYKTIRTDEDGSMSVDDLERAIKVNKDQGLIPFFLCGTLGSTDTCSFDDLAKLGPVCKREGMWLHVDAAYAGSAFVCPEFRPLLDGVVFADSFNVNPHKLLLTNGYCSVLWVKDKKILKESLHVDPVYLRKKSIFVEEQIMDEDYQPEDYKDWEIPLGRHIKSLKLWFVLRYYGLEGLQRHIRNHVKLAKLFESLVKRDGRFMVVNRVVLGLVCFRLKDADGKSRDEELIKAVNKTGKIHIGPGQFHQERLIRLCVSAEQTTERDMYFAWEVIQGQAEKILNPTSRREKALMQATVGEVIAGVSM